MSGAGRGRGWLNIQKSDQNELSSEPFTMPIKEATPILLEDENCIVQAISQFSPTDDGILVNRKLKFLQQVLEKSCTSAEQLEKSVDNVIQYILTNTELAYKLVILLNLKTFPDVEIAGTKIRSSILRSLQASFQNLPILSTATKNNLLIILIGFYSGTRTIFAQPIWNILESLLENDTSEETTIPIILNVLQFLAKVSPTNSFEKKSVFWPFERKVRSYLATRNYSEQSKLHLLLCIDILNYKNNKLEFPSELTKFYSENITDQRISLQLNPPDFIDLNMDSLTVDYTEKYKREAFPSFIEEPAIRNEEKNTARKGRPILGTGAKGTSKQNNPPRKPKNGWSNPYSEHDDRFENDYE